MRVKILAILPISFIFICAIVSQYSALIYINDYSQQLQIYLFQNQITFSSVFTSILSQQLNGEIQKYSQYVYLLNNYYSKILNGKVAFQDPHRYTFLEVQKKYERTEDPELLALYYQRPLLTNIWYHKNVTDITKLDPGASSLIRNASRYITLQRSIEYENLFLNYRNNRKLKFFNMLQGYEYEGMMVDSPDNTTFATLATKGCGSGYFPYDPRCRYWFLQGLQYESLIFEQPNIVVSSLAPSLSSNVCQKLYTYNDTLKSKEVYSVLCIGIQLAQIQNYFINFVRSTKQFYLIEPRSQIILFNSNQMQDLYNVTVTTLNQIEFQHLQSKEEAQFLNNTIVNNFSPWINQTLPQIFLNNSTIIQPQQIKIPYNRNGTQTTVILTPVAIYEKIPFYEGYANWVNNTNQKYYVEIPYLQINIISDQDLKAQARQVQQFFHNYFIFVYSILAGSAFISIFFINFYSNRIRDMFNFSIESLTTIIKQLDDEQIRDNIFSIDSEEMFYSYEASELYESFKGIYQILLYTSENFFSDNQTNTLLRLNRNIEFFKQFGNNEAVGITLNNIGSILLSQHHYLQALESFSESIIYAKYQIQQFCETYPQSISSQLLADYSYDNKFYLYVPKSTLNHKTSIFKSQGITQHTTVQNPEKYQQDQSEQLHGSIGKKSSDLNNQFSPSKTRKSISSPQKYPIKSTSQVSQQLKQNPFSDMLCSILNSQSTEKRLTLQFKNYLHNKLKRSSVIDKKIGLNQTKIGNEEHYEERMDLLTNLYQRKKNYVAALMAYQEYNDFVQSQGEEKEEKMKMRLNNQQSLPFLSHSKNHDKVYNNFWREIKSYLKELLVILKQLPIGETHKIEVATRIYKCQYVLDKKQKAKLIIKDCENQIKQLKAVYNNQLAHQQNNALIEETSNNTLVISQNWVTSNNALLKNSMLGLKKLSSIQEQSPTRILQIEQQSSRNYDAIQNTILPLCNNDEVKESPKNQSQNNYNCELPINNMSQVYSGHQNKTIFNKDLQIDKVKKLQESMIQEEKINNRISTSKINELKYSKNDSERNYEKKQQRSQAVLKQRQEQQQQKNKSKSFNQRISIVDSSSPPVSKNNSNHKLRLSQPNNTGFNSFNQQKSYEMKQDKKRKSKVEDKSKLQESQNNGQLEQSANRQPQNSNLEEIFHNQRVIENLIKEDTALLNIYSIDAQDAYIHKVKAERLFQKEKYIEAAFELIQLLEQQKYFPSHFPFKIFHLLKEIFEKLNISCRELNNAYKKFNPNLSLKVITIISTSSQCIDNSNNNHSQNNSIFKAVQFASNLVSNILNGSNDQFGVIIADNQEKNSMTYMIPTKVVSIKNCMINIVNGILNLTLKQSYFPQINELLSLSINIDESQNLNAKNEFLNSGNEVKPLKNTQSKQLNQQLFDSPLKNEPNESKLQQNKELFFQCTQQQFDTVVSNNGFGILTSQCNDPSQQLFHKQQIDLIDSPLSSRRPLNTLWQSPQQQPMHGFLYYPLKQEQNKSVKQSIGDEIGFEALGSKAELDISKEYSFSKEVDELEKDNYNATFHFCLRKALSSFSFFSSYFQTDFVNNMDSLDNTFISQDQKKFIVFTTDKILVYKNFLFNQLCQSLFNLDIVLLFLTFEKSSHFLETCTNQTYIYQEKEVIKVFYSNKKIQNYLSNQRDRFCKFEYPTIIQHF